MATSGILKMTAKELKNRTGEALRAVESGQRVLLTRRGRPIAVMSPATTPPLEPDDLPYDEAWLEVERALSATKPRERSWREAIGRSRRRS